MSGRMVEEGTPKSRPSIKAMKKLAKAVTINFFRTLENAQRLAATQGALRQKRMALSHKKNELCGILTYPSPIPNSPAQW